MALGDLQVFTEGPFGSPGTRRYTVQLGAAASINAGEPVAKALGAASGSVVAAMATNKPVAGTDYIAGVAQSTSTDTTTASGVVDVIDIFGNDMTFLISPKVAATFNTQAKYDALVGYRILLDLTAGVYTALAADSANNGCVIQPLDVTKYPGKVRVSFRRGLDFLA